MMNDGREEQEVKRNKYLSGSSIKLFDHLDRLVSTHNIRSQYSTV